MKVNVLCHVERLPEYDEENVYFSLNVTAALGEVAPEDFDGKLVSPWEWKVGKLRVYLEKANKLVSADFKEIDLRSVVDIRKDGPFAKQLETVRAEFLKKLALFKWIPAADETLTRDAENARWHEFLIHASTFPAPLAHQVQLAYTFAIKAADLGDADRILAAPILDLGDGKEHKPQKETELDLTKGTKARYVQIGTTGKNDPPFFYEWLYDGSGHDVAAYQRECLLEPKSKDDQFLELNRGWIARAGDVHTATEDWSLVFEQRAAAAFDLPLRMLEALEKETLSNAQRQQVIDAVFAVFRDIATIGVRKNTSQRIVQLLAEEILHELTNDKTIQDNVLQKLVAFNDSVTRGEWLKILTAAVPTDLFDKTDAGIPLIANDAVVAELRRIHGLLAAEEVLRELLIAQWDAALDVPLKAFLAAKREVLRREILPKYNLRNAWLMETLQEIWQELSAFAIAATPVKQLEQIRSHLEAALLRYFHQRFKLTSAGTLYQSFRPEALAPADFVALIETYLKDYVKTFTNADDKRLIRTDATNDRDALVVQIADVMRSHEDAGSSDDQHESSRRISGYGLLMRRTKLSVSAWTCPNLARVLEPETRTELVADAVPVPLRLGYRNGVRQTFVTYENQPLVAEAPMQRALVHSLEGTSSAGEGIEDFFVYANPYGISANAGRIVPLVYGEDYDVAAYAIGNAGVLPKGLEGKKDGNVEPCLLRKIADAEPPADVVRKLPYRRRTPVGLPRVGKQDGRPAGSAFETLALPTIPNTVLPIARSLKPKEEKEGTRSSRPLLLLHPAKTTFPFALYSPTVDLNVWDRWVSVDSSNANLKKRISVMTEYHQRADKAGVTMNESAKREDISVDDPAVTTWMARLTQRWDGKAEVEKKDDWTKIDLLPSGASEGLASARMKPVKLVVGIGAKNIKATGEITVPAGEVWTLEIAPAVKTSDFKERFASDVQTFDEKDTFTLFEPFALDVEVVPASLNFDANLLRDALMVAPAGLRAGRKDTELDELVVSVDPEKLTATIAPWIHRVEAVVQQWRWSGRPIARPVLGARKITFNDGYDFTRPITAEDDAVLFGDRSPLDVLVIPSVVDFVARPKDTVVLHRRDLSRTPGALYFRLAFRCFSRYEGLFDVSGDSRTGVTPEGWTRKVVPSTWSRKIPQPVVKLIVPLTRPIGSDETPPLLAVLDEPWGDVGGLAEEFVAEIMNVSHLLPDEVKPRRELGRDPILSLKPVDEAFTPQLPIGPIGYTFDTDTDAPLFVKSSFLLPPPKITGIADLSWFFVKMQFKRRLKKDGTVGATEDQHSDPTPPVWCQYLPPSTRFALLSGKSVDVSTLRVRTAAKTPQLFDVAGKAVALKAAPVDEGSICRFQLYVLVTEPISDAAGRPDQEAFLHVYRIDYATGLIVADGDAPDLNGRAVRARIIEVQARSDAPQKNLWDALFTEKDQDAEARIVRMSPPIGM